MNLTGEATQELAKKFSFAVAFGEGFIYGMNCDATTPIDRLVRVAAVGGEVESLIEVERPKPQDQFDGTYPCDYRSLAVSGDSVYAAHWNGKRIVRFDLRAKNAEVIVKKKIFPDRLSVDSSHLVFQASDGIYRVSPRGVDVKRFTSMGAAPFSYFTFDDKSLYVHEGIAYGIEEWTYELPWATGKATKFQLYQDKSNLSEGIPWTGIMGIALDSECLYTARKQNDIVTIFARAR
jgi:hypothetical protein